VSPDWVVNAGGRGLFPNQIPFLTAARGAQVGAVSPDWVVNAGGRGLFRALYAGGRYELLEAALASVASDPLSDVLAAHAFVDDALTLSLAGRLAPATALRARPGNPEITPPDLEVMMRRRRCSAGGRAAGTP